MRHSITLQTFPHSHQTTRSIHSLQAQRQGNQLLSQGETLASPCIGVLRFQKGPSLYKSNVYSTCSSSEHPNHSVLLSGRGTNVLAINLLSGCTIRVKDTNSIHPYSQAIVMYLCPLNLRKDEDSSPFFVFILSLFLFLLNYRFFHGIYKAFPKLA